jgi:D-inositol-3-phosphate glycosyltransferase
MKIAIITLEYPPNILGGAGVAITRIASAVAALGDEIHVLTPNTSNRYGESMEQGIRIHRLPSGPLPRWKVLSFWWLLPRFYKKITRECSGFDLVHGNGVADLSLRRPLISCPRIVTVHHLASRVVELMKPSLWERLVHPGDETGFGPFLEARIIPRADCLVAVSGACRSDIISRFGLPGEKIRVILQGADSDGYDFSAEEISELRKKLGAENRKMILFVGRLEPRKGIEDLLHAFSVMDPSLPSLLVLAGNGQAGMYAEMIEKLGIKDKVVFTGFIPSSSGIRKLYSACDLVVIPSLYEGLGMVALEARAAGKYSVAYRIGGLPEAIPEGAGMLVPPRDWQALSRAMNKALGVPHGGIPKPRSWNETGLEYQRLYREVVSNQKGTSVTSLGKAG